ncbi:hypothetical protein [Curtobacterium sp. MCBA15_004]|uniref:hypothetical protein n=1 Tax=Curtobacterium sp. MCBA15_004 TaxID=1898733 RepID=UPI00111477D8|nr:hypothetical protein [Curtobacterium sp. MCBA15_004]WIA96452.1 hypothetical protein QOL16_15340 [Curtobacterium sp. MCBA15_004]
METRAAAAATGSVIDALGRSGNTLDTLAQATGISGSALRARLDETSELTWGELVIAGGLSCVHPSDFVRAAA